MLKAEADASRIQVQQNLLKKKTQTVTNSDKNSDRDSETGTANIQRQELTKTEIRHRA